MSESEKEIREWLKEAADVHRLESGDLVIVRVKEPSVQSERHLWDMFAKALKEVDAATGKNVTVLFLTAGWDVEVVPRAKTKEMLEKLLKQMDDAMETCRSCGKVFPKRDRRCPVCRLKVRT